MSSSSSPLSRLIRELRRRRVFRTAGIYIFGTWLLLQLADVVFPGLGIPEEAIRYVLMAALAGFPVALVFGWYFDIDSGGIIRTAPAEPEDLERKQPLGRSDFLILGALAHKSQKPSSSASKRAFWRPRQDSNL